MSDSVDDDFVDRFLRHLVFDGRGGAGGACADRSSEFGHDEIHRIIHLLKEGALKDLMRRDRLGNLDAVVVGAFDDRGGRMLLRVSAEQQNRGVRDTVAVGQISAATWCGIERFGLDDPAIFEILDEAVVEQGCQVGRAIEPLVGEQTGTGTIPPVE